MPPLVRPSMHGSADRRAFIALLVLLVWLPLPLGSNRGWALMLMQMAVALIGLHWLWRHGGSLGARLAPVRPILVLFSLWLGYGALQLLPWPRPLLTLLTPELLRQVAAAGGGEPFWLAPTLDWHASLVHWMQGLTLVSLFVLLLLLVNSHRRLRALAQVLVWAAVAQAMLASLVALSGRSWWFIAASPEAHGTFPNRNHLAAFLYMHLAIGIGLLLAQSAARAGPVGWRARLRRWLRALLGPQARLRIALAVLVVTLVLTSSRMGNLAFFASLLLVGSLGVLLSRRRGGPVLVLLASLVLIDLLILGGWFGLDRVQQRIAETRLTEETRFKLTIDATDYLADYLITGSGGGTFPTVFPAYRAPDLVPYHYRHAENDALEFLLEYGLVGFGVLAACVLATLWTAVRVLSRRQDALARGMAFASLLGITAVLLHSLTDFNLRIPANAALFMVLLALAWIAAALPGRRAG